MMKRCVRFLFQSCQTCQNSLNSRKRFFMVKILERIETSISFLENLNKRKSNKNNIPLGKWGLMRKMNDYYITEISKDKNTVNFLPDSKYDINKQKK